MDEMSIIRIKNNLSEIAHVSQLFNDFSMEHHLPKRIGNAIDLALDEFLNNIITYGYDDQKEHEISIKFYLEEDHVILEIEDDGCQFNPLNVPDADTESSLEERPIGGLGIHLIRNIMDDVHYEYNNEKNCLTMKKTIRG